jgi:hypothetical protein
MKKHCRQCQQDVRVADYYRHPQTADGLQPVCKACHRANVKANREARIDYYRAYERDRANLPHRVAARETYAQTPEGKSAGNRAKRRFIERNPAKRQAQVMVGNALANGRLARQPCEVCGHAKAQAHHDDYSKPLDVRWLCTTHHAEWHRHNTPKCPPQEAAA